jgi:hypothetical protein
MRCLDVAMNGERFCLAGADQVPFLIAPWDTDGVRAALEQRRLDVRVDTSDGSEIHVAQYKSYHTITPNGYDLQISYRPTTPASTSLSPSIPEGQECGNVERVTCGACS